MQTTETINLNVTEYKILEDRSESTAADADDAIAEEHFSEEGMTLTFISFVQKVSTVHQRCLSP